MSQQDAFSYEQWFRTGRLSCSDDLEAVYRLRYQVYCEERQFLDRDHYPHGLETDAYDSHSVHFAAFDETGAVAATARLVRPSGTRGFPFEQHSPVYSGSTLPDAHRAAEVSRLVLNRNYRRPPGGGHMGTVVLGIYREMYRYSIEHDVTHWHAAMERPLLRLLRRYGFDFQPIGPEIDYFGPVTVYCAEVAALIRGLESRRPALQSWFTSDW